MIYFLTGENDFELSREVKRLTSQFDGEVERIDGSELDLPQLSDILVGQSLFASKRLVVLSGLSENKLLWPLFDEWIDRVSDDIELVIVEPKPDKRSRTYKALHTKATTRNFPAWTERDTATAIKWVGEYATSHGVALTDKQARLLVTRAGVNQWLLHHAVEKLALLDAVTEEAINQLVDANPEDNVFDLLETALRGDNERLAHLLDDIARLEDPYRVFGLLSSQVLQLVALALAPNASAKEVAQDIGASPYALSKLTVHATRTGASRARALAQLAADTDAQMKSSGLDPWLSIAAFLQKIARE